jgi:hypothetical protein
MWGLFEVGEMCALPLRPGQRSDLGVSANSKASNGQVEVLQETEPHSQ